MIGFYSAGAMGGSGPPPGGTLYAEIMADIALYGGLYFRHGEASGSVMENETGADGAYIGSPSLGQPALYTGGPTSFLAESGNYGEYSTAMTGATRMTLVCIVDIVAFTGTYGGIISRDTGSGTRVFHWRIVDGGNMEFVNIPSGATTPASGIFTPGTPTMVAVTLGDTMTNSTRMYKDGVQVAVDSVVPTDWGIAGNPIQIGHMLGGFPANAYFSESAIIYEELSGARMAAYATAAGL